MSSEQKADKSRAKQLDQRGKYLTFKLGEEDYGIGILKVKEIIGMMSITAIPESPEFIKGVVNLRGIVIPIMDLRLKFRMESAESTDRTCIIVVEIDTGEKLLNMGVVVDTVSEVLNISNEEIEAPPDFGNQGKNGFIEGMAKAEGAVKILLDIDSLFSRDEKEALARAA